jgi:hypothetical protein
MPSISVISIHLSSVSDLMAVFLYFCGFVGFCLLWCDLSRPCTCGEDVTCQNSECSFYLLEAGKRVVKKGFALIAYQNSAEHQVCVCRHCNGSFVETVNTSTASGLKPCVEHEVDEARTFSKKRTT